MLLALLGAALAVPPAFLGAEGPDWIGPLPPGSEASEYLVLVVDPTTGQPFIEERDGLEAVRSFDGSGWRVGDTTLTPEVSPPPGVDYQFEDERLVSVGGAAVGRRQYIYEETGRIRTLVRSNGAVVQIRYDADGRVRTIVGPGPNRWALDWNVGDEGVERITVRDPAGRTMVLRWTRQGDKRVLEVSDPLGRVVRTRYNVDGEGTARVAGWDDPKGLSSHLRWRGDQLTVTDPVGRRWGLLLEPGKAAPRRLKALVLPGGARWSYGRDASGRITSITDPVGRVTRWQRDSAGRVVGVDVVGSVQRYERDGAGRVVAVVDPRGARTELKRDDRGRIVELMDAVGNAVFIRRFPHGQPAEIIGRSGGRWAFAMDLFGRMDQVVDPTDATVVLERDGAGRLASITDTRFGTTTIARGPRGRPTRIVGPKGRITGLVRDAADRLRTIIRPDGTQVLLRRDPAGDVIAVVVGETVVKVRRDPTGLPLSVDDVGWRRDRAGRVTGLTAPGVKLRLHRDPRGWLQSIRAGDWSLRIRRDSAGRPIAWEGTDAAVAVARDLSGQVVAEEGQVRFTLQRDPRGHIARIEGPMGVWAWMRDGSGRVLRVTGPGNLSVGVDRDRAGRPVLVRYPGGTIARRANAGTAHTTTWDGPDGVGIGAQTVRRDSSGAVVSVDDVQRGSRIQRYDPLGRLIAVERGAGGAWSWTMDGISGPDGEIVLMTDAGLVAEARPPQSLDAWNVAREVMTVYRDAQDRMSEVSGGESRVDLAYDSLSRLVRIKDQTGGAWTWRYDARGRPIELVGRDGVKEPMAWHPSPERGRSFSAGTLLSSGRDWMYKWIAGPFGVAGSAGPEWRLEYLTDDEGTPLWVKPDDAPAVPIATTPLGFPDSDAAGLVGAAGRLQVFAGGPLLDGRVAVDPVSGQRVDGVLHYPWQTPSARATGVSDRWDDDAWAPESRWRQPVELLVAMGLVEPLDAGDWVAPSPRDVAVDWLPRSWDVDPPPLGPHPNSLPISADPITLAFIRAVLPGGDPPAPGLVLDTLLDHELVLPQLPPGLEIPGMTTHR